MDAPGETRYLRRPDGVYIAYRTAGEGPDVVVDMHQMTSNLDLIWDEPTWGVFLRRTAEFGRVILHDRRGLGVSSRTAPPPTLETRARDLVAVLDEIGSEQPVLASAGEPGAMLAFFAATYPDRVSGLMWNIPTARAAWAPDYPWGGGPADFERALEFAAQWGTSEWGRGLARYQTTELMGVPEGEVDSMPVDEEMAQTFARITRNVATPDVAEAIERIWWQTDVRAVLPSVQARTLVAVGELDHVAEAEYIASLMPNARCISYRDERASPSTRSWRWCASSAGSRRSPPRSNRCSPQSSSRTSSTRHPGRRRWETAGGRTY